MILLSQQLKQRLNLEIREYEEEVNMAYVTSMEESGIKKGIEKGVIQVAKRMIQLGKSDKEIAEATDLSPEAIAELRGQD